MLLQKRDVGTQSLETTDTDAVKPVVYGLLTEV